MQRIRIAERAQWRARAEEAGFRFHTIDGQPYWDERAYYAFIHCGRRENIEPLVTPARSRRGAAA